MWKDYSGAQIKIHPLSLSGLIGCWKDISWEDVNMKLTFILGNNGNVCLVVIPSVMPGLCDTPLMVILLCCLM